MMENLSERQPDAQLSSHEEHIWMLQQQSPDGSLSELRAWRLRDTVELPLLQEALQALTRHYPDLVTRYRFCDDGELVKTFAAATDVNIDLRRAHSPSDTTRQLLELQEPHWDLESTPPFKATIIHDQDGVVLGIALHHILAEMYGLPGIIRSLSRLYLGKSVTTASPGLLLEKTSTKAPIPWSRHTSGYAIQSFGGSTALSDPGARLALKYSAWLPAEEASSLVAAQNAPEAMTMRAVIAARFVSFIAKSGRHTALGVHLYTSGSVHRLTVSQDDDDAVTRQAINEAINGQPLKTSDHDQAQARITLHLGDEPGDLSQLVDQELPIPTREAHDDITLHITSVSGAGIALMLTTGQSVSSHAGAFILDRFLGQLQVQDRAEVDLSLPQAEYPTDGDDSPNPAMLILDEFRATLDAPEMQLEDDFFDFGGHSLLATRIIGRLLDSHGLEINFNDFFSAPSAAALASRVSFTATPEPSSAPVAEQVDAPSKAPLALAQTSLWKAYVAHDYGTLFNLPFALEFLDEVDESLFEQAFHDVLERHAGLRTLFYQHDDGPWQHPLAVSELKAHRWFWNSHESQEITLQDEASYRFDLGRELPVRVRFLRDSRTGHQILSLLVHHMAIDEWSLNTIMADIHQAYLARSEGREPIWTSAAPPFHDFAFRQHVEGANPKHLQYWKERLVGAQHLRLALFDNAPSQQAESTSLAAGWIEQPFDRDVSDKLYDVARQHNASLFNLVYTAIVLSLHRIGKSPDIIIGTSASGRTDPAFYETVGYFTTMIAHRTSVTPEMPIAKLLDNIQHQIGESMAYADVPIDLIQQALGMVEDDDLLFEAYVQIHAKNALNGSLTTSEGDVIRYRQIDPDKSESMFDLQFEIMEDWIEGENHLRLVITYNADRYRQDQAETLGATIGKVLIFFTQQESLDTTVSEAPL